MDDLLLFSYHEKANIVLLQGGGRLITDCQLNNASEIDWQEISVKIVPDGELIQPSEVQLDMLRSGLTVRLSSLELVPSFEKLYMLTEACDTSFSVVVTVRGEEVFRQLYPIQLLPYDYWLGAGVRPELTCCFCQPNLPDVERICERAAALLQERYGSSSMTGYTFGDPNMVRREVAAIYDALREEGLSYVLPPPSFEVQGQRIRMADRVLSERRGTCIDTTLLMASCFEASGLEPLIIILQGHAIVGVRLVRDGSHALVDYDDTYLKKGIADGVNDIVLIETVALTHTSGADFENAVIMGEQKLMADNGSFAMSIDVNACRMAGILPLPIRIKDSEGRWHLNTEKLPREFGEEWTRRKSRHELRELSDKNLTRQEIWERKLLDLTLNNSLLNLEAQQSMIPLIIPTSNMSDVSHPSLIDRLEYLLTHYKDFSLKSVVKALPLENEQGVDFSSLKNSPAIVDLINSHSVSHQLLAGMYQKDLEDAQKKLYRKSRMALEENGANSLFLTIGELVWARADNPYVFYRAPLLLLPVELVQKNFTKYIVRAREEEMFVNSTLLEMLKHEYEIEIPLPSPLPKVDNRVDVRFVLSQFRQSIRQMAHWDVVESAYIGFFSFSKFVMWNDIHTNAEKMKEHQIVSSLLDGVYHHNSEEVADVRQADLEVKPSDMALPLSVDSSQLAAIAEAAQGKSFVLHGPPGTGKSQTIANMIANALYSGKRVLFVAEKKAALEVVQHRLEQIGLAPFCLELHSNKATKSHCLQQLEETLELAKLKENREFGETSSKLFSRRLELAEYMNRLHDSSAYGISLYECIEGYISEKRMVRNLSEDRILKEEDLQKFGRLSFKHIDDLARMLENLDIVMQITGYPANHPLREFNVHDAHTAVQQMKEIPELQKRISEWRRMLAELSQEAGFELPLQMGELMKVRATLQRLLTAEAVTLDMHALSNRSQSVAELVNTLADWHDLKAELLERNSGEFLTLSSEELRHSWEKACNSFFLVRGKNKREWLANMQRVAAGLTEPYVEALLNRLADYERLDGKLRRQREALRKGTSELEKLLSEYGEVLNSWREVMDMSWLENGLDSAEETASQWLNNRLMLRDWMQWIDAYNEICSNHLEFAVKDMLENGLSGKEAAAQFRCNIYRTIAEMIIEGSRELSMFNGLLFERKIMEYRRLDEEFRTLSIEELKRRLIEKVPAGIPEPSEKVKAAGDRQQLTDEEQLAMEVALLKRNIKSHGRGNSIRHIFEQIPAVLTRLCPCMLMSPMSVAQYLHIGFEPFDLVIFDEASQIPTSEAVGSIARGKSLVVVGDPKQMPPTNFFSTNMTSESEADIDDMESILDDCIALSMPSRYLEWHYRSRHESLIAFSNSEYYNRRLFTFPSVDNRISKVTYQHVDGVYDMGKSRCNRAEAEAIVNEVVRRLKDEELSEYSIGIVSFSAVQRNLIDDLLAESLSRHKDLREKAMREDEPLFVKNLENVQGDERDVILFSVGYGPDSQGKVSMNFGPLNLSGGERRLNVAVSRARFEMKVFSTLRSSQIDLKRTQAEGVKGLKRFLEFAERGSMPVGEENTAKIARDALRADMAEELRMRGFEVDEEVGRSKFHIDLAVYDKDSSDKYKFCILLDGPGSYGVKTVKDRNIVQDSVLEGLGWKVIHAWSLDWFTNKERALQRLLNEF